jgi:hypothetical protein
MQTYMNCSSNLSYLIISYDIRFFCLHHGCRFVCARINVFPLPNLLPMLYFSVPISKKIEKTNMLGTLVAACTPCLLALRY